MKKGSPICGRYPHLKMCGCTIPCRIAMKEVTLDAVRPLLFIGPVQAAYLDKEIEQNGISHIINASNSSYTARNGLTYLTLNIDDKDNVDMTASFKSSIKFIGNAHENGGGVLVHCHAGKSRSAAICAAYLMHIEGLTATDALSIVQEAHPRADPNLGFRHQLERASFLQ